MGIYQEQLWTLIIAILLLSACTSDIDTFGFADHPQQVNDYPVVNDILSPNADGENDALYVRGPEGIWIRAFSVYNRWGEPLFQAMDVPGNDAAYGWDGREHAQEVLPGTYTYIAVVDCPGNVQVELQGHVALVR